MTTLSIGKLRSLQQCASARGTFAALALDHRQNLRHALNPQSPDSVADAELTQFKLEVTKALAPAVTAVLLDPEYGAAQAVAANILPGHIGLVVAAEATGYTGDSTARQSRFLDGWSVAKAKRLGANAVKLLVYYHPDSPTAPDIEAFVKRAAADCAEQEIVLMLEPLSYSLDPANKKLSSTERRRVVIETARRLVIPGVDLLKAEFPVDAAAGLDEGEWEAACRELSAACPAPWIVLSAAADFEMYLRQVRVACEAGASGIAAGRAVWKEAVSLKGETRTQFLRDTARPRLARLTSLCDALARPWMDIFTAPTIAKNWHAAY